MMELLDPRRMGEGGIFEPAAVRTLVEEHLAGRHDHSHVLWSPMVFQDWQGRWGC